MDSAVISLDFPYKKKKVRNDISSGSYWGAELSLELFLERELRKGGWGLSVWGFRGSVKASEELHLWSKQPSYDILESASLWIYIHPDPL